MQTEGMKPFKFGWYGDGGLGEELILAILAVKKTATAAPVYDPEEEGLVVGDTLQLRDKHGKARGTLLVTGVEIRTFEKFDDELARREGSSLAELKERLSFANGRQIRSSEEMRIIYFEPVK